jgi:Ni,Fe-hydrogenase III large subunit
MKILECVRKSSVDVLELHDWREAVIRNVREKQGRVAALFATPEVCGGWRLWAVVTDDQHGTVQLSSTHVTGHEYSSLSAECPQAHMFEREIFENYSLKPAGHPWLKPVRKILEYNDFFRFHGEEVHEVAVGPVHAGVIEPGHFRFQCNGEDVFHLEIALGYQHRGIEKRLIGGPDARTFHYMETLAGDTTIGHSLAYAQNIEALSGCKVSTRAKTLRAIALELERLANHTGDLGALAADVGFLPTSAFCGRLRGDFLNLSALICGNRFGRGMVKSGGAGFDINAKDAKNFLAKLGDTFQGVSGAAELLFDNASVLARFEGTGVISKQDAIDLGLVGVAARASGRARDVRQDFPDPIYHGYLAPAVEDGDVMSRAMVRWLEIQHSARLLEQWVSALPEGNAAVKTKALEPDSVSVSLVEGWRGEICHVAITDSSGKFAHYKIVDPSFHNWTALALALRGEKISDFPLCNKSFNLSYCGFDL